MATLRDLFAGKNQWWEGQLLGIWSTNWISALEIIAVQGIEVYLQVRQLNNCFTFTNIVVNLLDVFFRSFQRDVEAGAAFLDDLFHIFSLHGFYPQSEIKNARNVAFKIVQPSNVFLAHDQNDLAGEVGFEEFFEV